LSTQLFLHCHLLSTFAAQQSCNIPASAQTLEDTTQVDMFVNYMSYKALLLACKKMPVLSEYKTQPKQNVYTLSSSGRFLVNQGWDLMPAMEILLAGLPTKILLIMSKHSREICRFVGKLYFTPMILCSHALCMSTFWHGTFVLYNGTS